MQADVLLVDPPWEYGCWKGKKSRTADSHYATMTAEELGAVPVGLICHPGTALFLWVTAPMKEPAFNLIGDWGFEYVTTAFYWVKTTQRNTLAWGMGHYTRSNVEEVWLCRRQDKGAHLPKRGSRSVHSVVLAPRRRHSHKPVVVHQLIESLFPTAVNRVELFATEAQLGWVCTGLECDSRRVVPAIRDIKEGKIEAWKQ